MQSTYAANLVLHSLLHLATWSLVLLKDESAFNPRIRLTWCSTVSFTSLRIQEWSILGPYYSDHYVGAPNFALLVTGSVGDDAALPMRPASLVQWLGWFTSCRSDALCMFPRAESCSANVSGMTLILRYLSRFSKRQARIML